MTPITVLVAALGGEGGSVLAEWLYATAVRAGHPAQSTSIPGVAQRTGATTYYLEVWPQPEAALTGRRPVFSLNPVPGQLDLLVASELLEAARQVAAGMTSAARTTIVASTARALTVAEKMVPGDGRVDATALMAALQRHARATELLDLQALAAQAGTVPSAVLLGAIAASGVLPMPREAYEATIRAGGKGIEPSLRGFALAFDAVAQRQAQRAAVAQALAPQDLRALARTRLAAYQDEAYARLYDERLARLPAPCAQEAERWLATWMMFDDIVHVARLKLAASRLARVRREVRAGDDELLRVFDHFKPGVPEFAALLPPRWAARLQAWDRRRAEPWSLPLQVGTHTLRGALALRLVASLRGQRRRGQRFVEEQALIEAWLQAIVAGAAREPALGLELARCGRLVKGYGATNERGKATLRHILQHLSAGPAAAVAQARTAALVDDAGLALDQALAAHGAPPRPPREQPVRWYRRAPAARSG